MKRKIIVLMAASILFCTALIGCGKKESEAQAEQEISTEQETGTEPQDEVNADLGEETEEVKEENIGLPDGFVAASQEELDTLSNPDLLVDNLTSASSSIGITEVTKVIYGNYMNLSVDPMENINLDAYVETLENKRLLVSAMYLNTGISETWTIVSIKDVDSGHLYYVDDSVKETVDIYDYVTGELISEATKTSDELQEEIQQGVEAAEQEFEDSLEKLAESSGTAAKDISKLEVSGENIVDITIRDMKEYDYISDVAISIEEDSREVRIVVLVPSDTDIDTAKMAGEDVARYLASMAGNANSYFKLPGSDDLGGIYDKYTLLIYVDDGYKNFDLYGAKVTASDKITWR